MEHQAAVLAFHGINLRTSPTAPYPPYVPEIVLDAAPADYRPRFPDLQVQVVPAPGVPIPATVLASDQPSGAHVPCQCDLRRLLTDPVRADVLATADNTRCECGVMGFSAQCINRGEAVVIDQEDHLLCAQCSPYALMDVCGCLCSSCDIHDYTTDNLCLPLALLYNKQRLADTSSLESDEIRLRGAMLQKLVGCQGEMIPPAEQRELLLYALARAAH